MLPPNPRELVPRRIVVGATAHVELGRALHGARAGIEVRGNTYDKLKPADLEWGDTYVGFRRPPLESMGKIRWVHCTGAGVDAWLLPEELSRQILLTRTAESFGPMIAEWALARALAFSQKIVDFADSQIEKEWKPRDVSFLAGTRALIVGTGDVGTHVGRAFAAMGVRVSGISRSGSADRSVFSEMGTVSDLRDRVANANWLIIALPLTNETKGLISKNLLACCRGAFLINPGRGAVVDEKAIPDAVKNGRLKGAALDVFTEEPLSSTSPLWSDRRIMISPHISGPTTVEGAVSGFLECVAELERGEWPRRMVDRELQY